MSLHNFKGIRKLPNETRSRKENQTKLKVETKGDEVSLKLLVTVLSSFFKKEGMLMVIRESVHYSY